MLMILQGGDCLYFWPSVASNNLTNWYGISKKAKRSLIFSLWLNGDKTQEPHRTGVRPPDWASEIAVEVWWLFCFAL